MVFCAVMLPKFGAYGRTRTEIRDLFSHRTEASRINAALALLELVERLVVAVRLDEQGVHRDGLVVVADLLVRERAVHRGLGGLVSAGLLLERDLDRLLSILPFQRLDKLQQGSSRYHPH